MGAIIKRPFHAHKRTGALVIELVGPDGKVWARSKKRARIRQLARLCNQAHAAGMFASALKKIGDECVQLGCTCCSNVVQAEPGLCGSPCRVCNRGEMRVL